MTPVMLSGRAKVAGVIGWPVSHSLSPRLHGYWLWAHGVDGAYVPLPVRPALAERALRALPALGLAGANITVPHKEAALAAVDEASAEARRIGAVNTLIVREDGSLFGANSDGFGFVENLRQQAPHWSPPVGPVLVLGAGGAGRAVVAALLDAGVATVRLSNRHRARAEALAAHLGGGVEIVAWAQRSDALADAVLIVNTTTLGMVGQPPLDLDLSALPRSAAVVDIVYNPLTTPLLADAGRRGNAVVDGLGMLLHQGRPGFAAWFGIDPPVTDALRAHVLQGLG